MCLFSSCNLDKVQIKNGIFNIIKNATNNKSETEILKEKQQIVIKAFQEKDFELLKTVLSKEVLKADDLEEGFNYSCEIFAYIEILNTNIKFPVTTGHFGKNESHKYTTAKFYLTTNTNVICVNMLYCFYNRANEDCRGVNYIAVNLMDVACEPDLTVSGVYSPSWNDFLVR